MVNCWNCKEKLNDLFMICDPGNREMNLSADTMNSWKKELVGYLKEWDKIYPQHVKSIYPEMNAIHMQAMKPLMDLCESNYNFYNLEKMIENKKDYQTHQLQPPDFRFRALEEEFVKYLTGVCEIFKNFGDLKDHFDIRQMLETLKLENWKEVPPFHFYLQPLANLIKKLRDNLLKMRKNGHLRMKYIIEHNKE